MSKTIEIDKISFCRLICGESIINVPISSQHRVGRMVIIRVTEEEMKYSGERNILYATIEAVSVSSVGPDLMQLKLKKEKANLPQVYLSLEDSKSTIVYFNDYSTYMEYEEKPDESIRFFEPYQFIAIDNKPLEEVYEGKYDFHMITEVSKKAPRTSIPGAITLGIKSYAHGSILDLFKNYREQIDNQ